MDICRNKGTLNEIVNAKIKIEIVVLQDLIQSLMS